jgi:hypothetical protein
MGKRALAVARRDEPLHPRQRVLRIARLAWPDFLRERRVDRERRG